MSPISTWGHDSWTPVQPGECVLGKTNSKQGYEDNFFSKPHFYQLLQLTDTHRKNKQM